MRTKIIEATNDQNWGKFLLGVFTDEDMEYRSKVDGYLLLPGRGIYDVQGGILIVDLQTKEGAIFQPRQEADFDSVKHDLGKHRIWVCPMYEYFLRWLYKQPKEKIYTLELPELVNLDTDFFAMYGYRRPGPATDDFFAHSSDLTLDTKRGRYDRVVDLLRKQWKGPTATKVDLYEQIRAIVLGE